jgi:FkbM family methyltransferase
MMLGVYEPDLSAWIRKHVRPGMRIVDAGAHVGYHTLHFAVRVGAEGWVMAVEFDPRVLSLLEKNLQLYGLDHRVRIVRGALGAKVGRARARLDLQGRLDPEGSLVVPVWTLDELLEGSCVEGIKLDVEGAEWDVLQGARRIFQRCRPWLIVAFHDFPERVVQREEYRWLLELGYRFTPLSPPGEELRWVGVWQGDNRYPRGQPEEPGSVNPDS